ncbi:M20 metallopeptidase family protein [Microbacterium alcoholitolerans]|uniref:M20 metallopeptidase family protein n=1 Tax=unclassified Microbacterium TaxID=2609290 RepID=UPI003D177382
MSADARLDETAIAAAVERAIVLRRRMHRHPETGLRLPRTQTLVADELRALDIPLVLGRSSDSVVGLIRGGRPGPTVLLRADMDALPIDEETDLPFSSETPGAMHACGHDLHTAGLLGAAALLRRAAEELAGAVVLMFQPGEEGWFGARHMIDEGVTGPPSNGLPAPSRAFALHVNPWYPLGTVNMRGGAILAAADTFRIVLTGAAGHGSAPHAAVDPIPAACELVGAIQTMVARTNPPFDPAVVSVTGLAAGSAEARSAIPGSAEITGTFRTHSVARRVATEAGLRGRAAGIAAAHGLDVEVEIHRGYPATLNDPAVVDALRPVLELRIPAGVNILADPLMGSEDFSYVLEQIPGVLAFVGTTPVEKLAEGWPADNHSARVDYDERAVDAFIRAHLAFVAAHQTGEHAA